MLLLGHTTYCFQFGKYLTKKYIKTTGVINKITTIISGELRINISALTIESREGLFEGTIKVFVHDKEELEELVERLRKIRGIHTVDRFDAE